MKKRVLAAVMAAALTIPAVAAPAYCSPAPVFTAGAARMEQLTDGVYNYAAFDGAAGITGLVDKGISGDIVIPAEIDGYPVISLAPHLFENTAVTSVGIPDSVTYIGDGIFSGCSQLSEVKGGDGLTEVGNDAFAGTPWLNSLAKSGTRLSLGKVLVSPGFIVGRLTVPVDTVSLYGGLQGYNDESLGVYSQINVSDIVLADGYERITGRLSGFGSRNIYIPVSLNYIEKGMLNGFRDVWYEGTAAEWNAVEGAADVPAYVTIHYGAHEIPYTGGVHCLTADDYGITNDKAYTIGSDGSFDYMVYSGSASIIGPVNKEELSGGLVIPSEFEGKPVTVICADAFRNTAIASVEIPDTVTMICRNAFSGCSQLTEVKGGRNVSETGAQLSTGIFTDTPWYTEGVSNGSALTVGSILICSGLCSGDYVMPDGMTAFGSDAFAPVLPVGGAEYRNPDLVSVTLSEGIKAIPNRALFSNVSVSDVYIPASVKYISGSAFYFSAGNAGLKDIWYAGTQEQWDEISGELEVPDYVTVHFGAESIGNKPAFVSNSMTLGSTTSLNFYVDLSCVPDDRLPDTYAVFELNGGQQTVNIDLNRMNKAGTAYRFSCNLNSISMADDVKAVIHYFDADGREHTSMKTATCEQYLRKFSEELDGGTKTWELIKGINDYGYYMQRYLCDHSGKKWTLGADHKAMSGFYRSAEEFSNEKAAYLSALASCKKSVSLASDIQKINYSLVLDSETAINFKIKPAANYTGDISITVDGKAVTPKKLSDGRYQVSVTGIPAYKLNTPHTVKVETANGVSTFTASVLSYVYECVNAPLDESEYCAMCALYEYYKAVVAYRS